jgi:hypothetical protein
MICFTYFFKQQKIIGVRENFEKKFDTEGIILLPKKGNLRVSDRQRRAAVGR